MKVFYKFVVLLFVLATLGLSECQPTPVPFAYQVHVRDRTTTADLENAEVRINLGGEFVPKIGYTNNLGITIFDIDSSIVGQRGQLTINAEGYEPYDIDIQLVDGQLPTDIRLSRKTGGNVTAIPTATSLALTTPPTMTSTPAATATMTKMTTKTPTNQPTDLPTHTPTHTPTPVKIDRVEIMVLNSNTEVYTGPSVFNGVRAMQNANDVLEVLGKTIDAKWFNVRRPDGIDGWIEAENVTFVGEVDVAEISVVTVGVAAGETPVSGGACSLGIGIQLDLATMVVTWSGVAEETDRLVLSIAHVEDGTQIVFPSNIDKNAVDQNTGYTVAYDLGNRQIAKGESYVITLQAVDVAGNSLCTARDTFTRPNP